MQANHPTYTIVQDAKDAEATAFGFYEPNDKIEKIHFKLPPVGDDELRIKTTYAGLCHSDVHTVRNEWYEVAHRPIVPGHEIVGIVEKVGKNVTEFKVGEHVGFGCFRDFCGNCKNCKNGDDHFCQDGSLDRFTYGGKYWGGYADRVQQPAKLFFHLPEGINEELTAPLFCAGITSYSPMKAYVKEGDEVAVLGVGGVGHMAVQYLKSWGAKVTSFTSSSDKVDFLKKLGSHEVVVTTEEGSVEKLAGKFSCIMNFLPIGETKEFQRYFNALANMGTFVQIGAPDNNSPVSFDLKQFVLTEKKLVGSLVGPKQRIVEMLDFSVKHDNMPMCEVFDFEDFPKAYDRLVNGRPKFRCVVKFNHNLE